MLCLTSKRTAEGMAPLPANSYIYVWEVTELDLRLWQVERLLPPQREAGQTKQICRAGSTECDVGVQESQKHLH